MIELKDRIKQLMVAQKLSQQEFAEKLKISPASLSSIFNDRTKPTINHVEAVMSSFPNINLRWLMAGEGEMFLAPGAAPETVTSSGTSGGGSNGSLFLDFENPAPTPRDRQAGQRMPNSGYSGPDLSTVQSAKIPDKKPKQITEIRIFYDDQTWESFVPKK